MIYIMDLIQVECEINLNFWFGLVAIAAHWHIDANWTVFTCLWAANCNSSMDMTLRLNVTITFYSNDHIDDSFGYFIAPVFYCRFMRHDKYAKRTQQNTFLLHNDNATVNSNKSIWKLDSKHFQIDYSVKYVFI